MNQRILALTTIGALAASLAITGCSRQDRADAKSATDNSVAQMEKKSRELGNDAAKGIDQAKGSVREMAQDVKDASKNASDKIGDKVADAVITTSVKAELAKDPNLSALKINVDTDNGRVALRGTAPSGDARERATSLAAGVKGVASVANELTVEPAK